MFGAPQRPKWSVRGGTGLAPVESVHIMRDPPKSMHLRKKERVSFDDVAFMLREEPDRYSDHIQLYARGVNPAVSVSYSNYGNGNNSAANPGSMAVHEGKSPYPVNRDGSLRPPIMRREDYHDALSRMPRNFVAYQPSVGLPTDAVNSNTEAKLDKQLIRSTIRPSASYNIGEVDRPYLQNKVVDPLHYTMLAAPELEAGDVSFGEYDRTRNVLDVATRTNPGADISAGAQSGGHQPHLVIRPSVMTASGFGAGLPTIVTTSAGNVERHIKDQPLIAMMTPVFTIAVKNDQDTNLHYINIPEKEKVKIAARADARLPLEIQTDNGQVIKLKDYNWMVYQTTPEMPSTLVLEQNPTGIRVKHLNTQAVMAGVESEYSRQPEVLAPDLERRQALVSVRANVAPMALVDNVNRDRVLAEPMRLGSYESRGFIPVFEPVEHHATGIDFHKSALKKKAFDLYADRYLGGTGPR